MELTNDELQDQLRELGKAKLSIDGQSAKDVRGRLIGAAKFLGVRVSVTRDADNDVMIATVLSSEEAAAQARRSARFRAARQVKEAVNILEHEQDEAGLEAISDILTDLKEIFGELEEG